MTEEKFVVDTPLGYKVLCNKTTWENHISAGHEVMQKNIDAVIETLQNPNVVYESAEHSNRDVFFGLSENATYGTKLYTTVVVNSADEYNDIGDVVTAFPRKDIGGNINAEKLKFIQNKSR